METNNPIKAKSQNVIDSSKIVDYMRCPRYFFFRHILGWRTESPNNHLVFGTAWHLAMEHLLLHGYGDKAIIDAFNLFLEEYRKTFTSETDELFAPKTPDNAFLVLAKYAQHYDGELEDLDVLYTEIAGSVAVDETHSLAFRMDSIIRNNVTGRVFSREHKTGSRLWMWDEQWLLGIQPATYSHVLYCLYPRDEVDCVEMNGCFFIKRKKDPYDFHRYEVRKRKDQMQVWMDTVRYYLWEIDREYEMLEDYDETQEVLPVFPMRPTNCIDYGRVCEYQDFCLAWSNPLRRMYEPPIGFVKEYWDPMEREAKHKFDFEKKNYADN